MSVTQNKDLNEIYISRKVILSYLNAQNYNTEPYEKYTIAELNVMNLGFEVEDKNDETRKCKVYYHDYLKSIKKTQLQEIISDYYDFDSEKRKKCSLIIILNSVNDTSINFVREIWEKFNEYCVLYDMSSLQYNILEHDFVPLHKKLTSDEKEEIKQKYNISHDSQFPEISMFDPVAKAILLRPGEVCEIQRYDKNSFQSTFYRICVI